MRQPERASLGQSEQRMAEQEVPWQGQCKRAALGSLQKGFYCFNGSVGRVGSCLLVLSCEKFTCVGLGSLRAVSEANCRPGSEAGSLFSFLCCPFLHWFSHPHPGGCSFLLFHSTQYLLEKDSFNFAVLLAKHLLRNGELPPTKVLRAAQFPL